MATLLWQYDKDVVDAEGEPFTFVDKASNEFFERVVGLLPMHIPFMRTQELMRVLEVLVKRNLGGDRLFQNYLLLKVERTVKGYSVPQYCKLIRLLADKRYTHDIVFWTDYILKYVDVEEVQGGVKARSFKPIDAK